MLLLRIIRFRRTGESTRSDDESEHREQVVQAAEQTDLESAPLADGAPVPREFANPTDGTVWLKPFLTILAISVSLILL